MTNPNRTKEERGLSPRKEEMRQKNYQAVILLKIKSLVRDRRFS
jgi:hypothetical protein